MTMEEICALPVEQMAARDAHLWLWTTWNFLWSAPRVALSWGFQPSYLLTWAKPGLGVGGRFRHSAEYCLFCERGKQLPITRRDTGTWYNWSRGAHSQKPDAFYDLVESVSPGPRLEMFAREQRLGWATWGNEAMNHVTLVPHNDPKLSDGRGWRDRCAAGARRRQEAAGVTAAPVRCSAWLGVAVVVIWARGGNESQLGSRRV